MLNNNKIILLIYSVLWIFSGPGVVAATSSIPTKYQTIVTSNADKKGFGGTTKRFNHDLNTVSRGVQDRINPGPVSYCCLFVCKHICVPTTATNFALFCSCSNCKVHFHLFGLYNFKTLCYYFPYNREYVTCGIVPVFYAWLCILICSVSFCSCQYLQNTLNLFWLYNFVTLCYYFP